MVWKRKALLEGWSMAKEVAMETWAKEDRRFAEKRKSDDEGREKSEWPAESKRDGEQRTEGRKDGMVVQQETCT